MTAAADLLADVRRTLDDVIHLLTEHRKVTVLPGIRNLRAAAEDDGRPAERVLADLDRRYWDLMGIPDGFSATYLQDDTGVDRDATRRLDDLRDRLAQLFAAREEVS